MELLELTDSLVETPYADISANLKEKSNLKSYNEPDAYTEALLKKIHLEREIEERNKDIRVFCLKLSLFVLTGLATIYFVVEAIYA